MGNLQNIAFTKQTFLVANSADSDEIPNIAPSHLSFHRLLVSQMGYLLSLGINGLSGNPKAGTFTNSEYPDEMPHNASGSTLLIKVKRTQTKITIFFLNYSLTPSDM